MKERLKGDQMVGKMAEKMAEKMAAALVDE